MTTRKGRRAVFIDRDGVINEEREYVSRAEDFHLLPGAVKGLARLRDAGFALVVVTNQSGIARGLYGEADFETLTTHMRERLGAQGIQFAGVYHCPHHPTGVISTYRVECKCRKPQPGMLLHAARDLGLSLANSVLVGDKTSDIEAGRRAGLNRCVLVESGHALTAAERQTADACVADLEAAARWLTAAT
jgi:D-glycero-D-manno-heptose 1,7-bisphosphate phosphatase